MKGGILLSDEDIRHFICDGFVQLQSELDDAIHRRIDERIRWAYENEFHMGNNILARVPELHDVIESPRIHGALTSILGPDYLLYPHRAIHTSTPIARPEVEYAPDVDMPEMGEGSLAGSGWHQDAQSPLARPRYHVPRYVIVFYFPHDTTINMGPTRFQAGSNLYNEPGTPSAVVLPEFVPAGSVFLLHFDLVHSGFPNYSDHARYMVKFNFARTTHPDNPSWSNEKVAWQEPQQRVNPNHLPNTWSYLWHWMRGDETQMRELSPVVNTGSNQPSRLEAIYAARDIPALADTICARAGLGLHERILAKNANGDTIPTDILSEKSRQRLHSSERRWNERAIVMEDAAYSLAALGEASVPTLTDLVADEDPWVAINACFALGQIGPTAHAAMPAITELLDHPLQQVVRQALDALGGIGVGLNLALPNIKHLVTTSNPAWQAPEVVRGWTGEDGVRLNAVLALLNAATHDSNDLAAIENIFVCTLDDTNGYVAAIACEGLSRIGSREALMATVGYLKRRRWDDSLAAGQRIF